MNPGTLLHVYLVLHITGFTIMAGTVLTSYFLNKRLGRYLASNSQAALGMLESAQGLLILISVGAIVLVLTGIGLVSLFRESVTSMLWFRIKMILVLLVIINGIALARPAVIRLKKMLTDHAMSGSMEAVKNRLSNIYLLQLILFLIIFVLSVFQF